MNMFITDFDHAINVASYCDVHLNKMLTEQSQLLSNAHRIHDGRDGMIRDKKGKLVPYQYVLYHMGENNNEPLLYKMSHQGHPCTKWISESVLNYKFGYDLLRAMHEEYRFRFSKNHGSKKIFSDLRQHPRNMKKVAMTPIKAVTDLRTDNGSITEVYQKVFNLKFIDWTTTNKEIKNGIPSKRKRKVSVAWTNRPMPSFIEPDVKEMIENYG